jgi:hypothetical protein
LRVALGELGTIAVNAVRDADVPGVGADDGHVMLDLAQLELRGVHQRGRRLPGVAASDARKECRSSPAARQMNGLQWRGAVFNSAQPQRYDSVTETFEKS